MSKTIDCFFIGYNQMDVASHLNMLKGMGENSGAFRDFNLDFVYYEDKPYTAAELFNRFHKESRKDDFNEFNLGNVFNSTIAYLGTYLHRRGFNFDYVNFFQEEKDYLRDKLIREEILTIVIPTTLYVSPLPLLEVISFIRKYNKSSKIILGGPYISSQYRSKSKDGLAYFFSMLNADIYINSSQGETTLVNVINRIKNNLSFYDVPNITYKYNGEYISTNIEIENNTLEDNMVDWTLFQDRLTNMVNIRTAISCPFSCSYCEYPQHAGKYQTVGVDALEKELNLLASTGKVTSIMFVDDTFNVPPDRFKEILKMIIRNKYDFRWNSFFRCQFADEEMVSLMKESGCDGVYLGIESGSNEILKNMNKMVEADKYRKGIELLKKYDINILVSTLIGFPGETNETVAETIKFIEEVEPSFLRIHLWFCSQLVPIWDNREKYQIQGSQFEWKHATMNTMQACEHIEYMFNNLKNTNYIPQYNFDFAGVINLLHRGMKLEDIKSFIKYFNQGVREKNGLKCNISQDTESKLRELCRF
ncbi:hypothetical protein GCM10008904_21230 [Paraclostridium ghonii]|uniref:Radical SAM PhpK family P-methyltransferase n=1 Tax=Paraclostridium ghonii TaxID=29358 RepID=A0ABU0N034_9FIRM|nr:PhpK family radical SAM P-methyltransferase [Paeniclostridium ghonii]MDQ0556515.1 radical SAM PhpK family P-methyltransferase [Paeniclostridium ghonii]